ncbi:hypothetical protein R1flu_019906 [Riccia fluitans]|uniref:Mitochondrial import inner membrane translocase subunit TIM50 n=1 Tax=Riccia fluitans TaxID=41844 RepID=A0ABD1ZJY7_9MARC
MHDQSNEQEVVAKLKQEAAELQTRIDEQLVSSQELETQVKLKRRELVMLQANIDKLHKNAAVGSSLFRPMPIPPDIPRKKTLILDLNGVLCKIERSAGALRQAKDLGWPLLGSRTTWVVPRRGLREFLEQVLELFCVIIWTSRTERNTELVLEALESGGCLPPGVKSGQACRIWSQSHCVKVEGVSKNGIPILLKDFATLEFWNISTQDVLMIDDSPEKGMTNSPYSALYPPTFTPLVTSPDDDTYLSSKLLPWLKGWGNSVQVTRDYVEEWYSAIECRDPVDELVNLFNPSMSQIVQETLWRSVPSRERRLLLKENTSMEQASPPTSPPAGPSKKPPGPSKKSKNPPKHKRPKVARDNIMYSDFLSIRTWK